MNRPEASSSFPIGYADAVRTLFARKPAGRYFGIDRMRVLAEALGHPERVTPVIHVAGTNGKGSVAAMLESILRAAGWRTGLYTSPHLVDVGERVQVDRRNLAPAELLRLLDELAPVGERIARRDAEMRPSFFELMTAMAFLQFARTQCDIAVIEVGLGGRLDATNVVTPEASVITSIGLDHCEYLGNALEAIAREKAGIVKQGVPVVLGGMPERAEAEIREVARASQAAIRAVREEFGGDGRPFPMTALEGEYQRWNAATATLAATAAGPRWKVTRSAIERGLATVSWPGRWQRIRLGERLVILDASHNPEGAGVLDVNLAALRREFGQKPAVVIGVLGADRARPLMEVVCRHSDEIHVVVPNQPRACSFGELRSFVPPAFGGTVRPSQVERLFPAPGICGVGSSRAPVVVTGSIYLTGEVMARQQAAERAGTDA